MLFVPLGTVPLCQEILKYLLGVSPFPYTLASCFLSSWPAVVVPGAGAVLLLSCQGTTAVGFVNVPVMVFLRVPFTARSTVSTPLLRTPPYFLNAICHTTLTTGTTNATNTEPVVFMLLVNVAPNPGDWPKPCLPL